MSNIVRYSDSEVLVPTEEYPHASWGFEYFNPVQSTLVDIYTEDANVAVAASTSAGKTVCSELYLAHEIRKRGGKGVYLGPLKSLVKEKIDDWQKGSHHFKEVNKCIATGDFQLNAGRLKELLQSDLIVMTPEMLASKCRNPKGEILEFINSIGTLVIDESHLLTVPSRGPHLEVSLMKITEINPNIRIILLSATMPNVDEICAWISSLTNRKTNYLLSEYRPVPLNIHHVPYYDFGNSQSKLEQLIGTAVKIVKSFPKDKFILFVHTKDVGHILVNVLKQQGIESDFHNADRSLDARTNMEDKFRSESGLRVLVATSTLAWGLNMPARRVVILGVTRANERVPNYDIKQMSGRSGRYGIDPQGDVYIILPQSRMEDWIDYLSRPEKITSKILDFVGTEENPRYKTLAFHIIAEIDKGKVKTPADFKRWLSRSLASFQKEKIDSSILEPTLKLLEKYNAIVLNKQGEYECTPVGKIASMMYYSPFDIADLRRNMRVIKECKLFNDDFALSILLGNIDSYRWSLVNKKEKQACYSYKMRIDKLFGDDKIGDGALKYGCCYYNIMNGKYGVEALSSTMGQLKADMDRIFQVLYLIDKMCFSGVNEQWLKIFQMRMRYGVPVELLELCTIPNIAATRAKRLSMVGIKTLDQFISTSAGKLAMAMQCSIGVADKCLLDAKKLKDGS